MRLFFLLSGLLMFTCSFGQYYYNDVVVLKQTNSQYQALKTNRILLVNAKSFEGSDAPQENFVLQQKLINNWAQVITTSTAPSAVSSVSVADYADGFIKKSVDTGGNVQSTVMYTYGADGYVSSITTITADTFMNNSSTEVHQWFYSGGSPVRMLRIKDNTDTTIADFVKDEQGNIEEEHLKKRGRNVENYFYYYNNQHQLTDIVRYNSRVKKMLPDFLFEYDNSGRLAQLTQILHNAGTYLTWQYQYGENGLKQTETCYDKQKRVVGKIVYNYN